MNLIDLIKNRDFATIYKAIKEDEAVYNELMGLLLKPGFEEVAVLFSLRTEPAEGGFRTFDEHLKNLKKSFPEHNWKEGGDVRGFQIARIIKNMINFELSALKKENLPEKTKAIENKIQERPKHTEPQIQELSDSKVKPWDKNKTVKEKKNGIKKGN